MIHLHTRYPRTVDIALCCHFRTVPIALSDLVSGNTQLTSHTSWQQLSGAVDDKAPVVGNGIADRNVLVLLSRVYQEVGRVNCTLCRSVHIPQGDIARHTVQFLTAYTDKAQRQVEVGHQHHTDCGVESTASNLMVVHELIHLRQILTNLRRHDVQATTYGQYRIEVLQRSVEAECTVTEYAVSSCQLFLLHDEVDKVQLSTVRYHNTLRLTSRTRGVNHVGHLSRI